MRSGECCFGVYFPCYGADIRIALKWTHKQSVMTVQKTFNSCMLMNDGQKTIITHRWFRVISLSVWLALGRYMSLAQSKLRLCSANHRPGYWSNLPCDWPSTAWAYPEQETENGPCLCSADEATLDCWWRHKCIKRRMSIFDSLNILKRTGKSTIFYISSFLKPWTVQVREILPRRTEA